jgi:hypothetical protein
MALSDQLTDLASRTKKLEDAAAAARAKNRAKLEQDREKLHSTMTSEAKSIKSSADKAGTDVSSWWAETTARMEQQRADLRAKVDQRRAERQVAKAERNAADAEDYAADMVSWAAYALDSAEYAVIDATIARSEADELAAAKR